DHPGDRARRVPAVRLRDGGDALRARPVRGRAERGPLGSQGVDLRVHHDRSDPGMARPLRRRHQDHAVSGEHLPPSRRGLPQARRRADRHGAALPSADAEVNRAAGEAIRADKQWEAEQGFIRGWVAHIFHMKTASDPFKKLIGSGWKPTEQMANPDNYPVAIKVPDGPVTIQGTRRNARMLIEYVEGWLGGRGAKGIDSLEGKPRHPPALMEDLATGRMSVAQIAQRILHRARETNSSTAHDFALVKELLNEELADILTRRQGAETQERYRKALKIAMRW